MDDAVAATGAVRLIIHNDDHTPVEFVKGLLHHVFGRSEREAVALTVEIEQYGRLTCGPYPASVAKAIPPRPSPMARCSMNAFIAGCGLGRSSSM